MHPDDKKNMIGFRVFDKISDLFRDKTGSKLEEFIKSLDEEMLHSLYERLYSKEEILEMEDITG